MYKFVDILYRESAAISMVKYLVTESANVTIYDPKVAQEQIHSDLAEVDVTKEQGEYRIIYVLNRS